MLKPRSDKMKLKPSFIVLTFFFFASSLTVTAQKELNYIYLFDCTQSMEGYGGAPNIWETTKQYLKDDLNNLPDDANVFIVPFQGVAHPTIQSKASGISWGSIESKIDHYIKTHTSTNIVAAWDAGMKYIDPHKDNYFFVLTDGNDNVFGIEELCKRIKEWCKRNDSSHVFYVMLTNNARNAQIEEAARSCKNVTVIPLGGDHITPKPIVKLTPNNITINSDELTETHEVNITRNGEFNANISTKDKIFKPELEKGKFEKGKAKIKFNISSHELPSEDSYNFKCEVSSDELTIVNPEITITIVNIPEKTLDLSFKNEEEIYLGKAKFYPGFLFIKKKKQTTLTWDLEPIFNESALKEKSEVKFELNDNISSYDYDIYFNNELKRDRQFIVKTGLKDAIIGIQFHDNAKEGKRFFNLKHIKNSKIDRIDGLESIRFNKSIRAIYQMTLNPLLKGMIWLAVFCTIFLVVAAFFRRISHRKIKYNLSIVEPVNKALLRKNEARKLILTSNRKLKQSIFHELLNGKNKIIYDEFWLENIEFTSASKGVRVHPSKIYLCDPHGGILKPNDESEGLYTLSNDSNNQVIKIKIR